MTHDGSADDHQATDDHEPTTPSRDGVHGRRTTEPPTSAAPRSEEARLLRLPRGAGRARGRRRRCLLRGHQGLPLPQGPASARRRTTPVPGTGQVIFEVQEGDTRLRDRPQPEDEGVVASVEAFTDAAAGNRSRGIQVGFYQLKKKMTCRRRVRGARDPDEHRDARAVTIPEGLRVGRHRRDPGGEDRSSPRPQFDEGARRPDGARAAGVRRRATPEGYLFPATYDFGPKDDAEPTCSRTWSTAGSRRPTTPTSRAAPRRWATRPAR